MIEDETSLLRAGLRELKLQATSGIVPKLLDYGLFLLEENTRTNLTGARSLASFITNHVLDSLAPLSLLDLQDPVIDLGSGGGLPGIPAAIAYPGHHFVLIEPRAKRVRFLKMAIERLELYNVVAVKASARGPGAAHFRAVSGTVLIRALAPPTLALELGLELLRPGGTLLLYEGRSSHPTNAQKKTAARLGAGEIMVKRVRVPGLMAARHAWIIKRAKSSLR